MPLRPVLSRLLPAALAVGLASQAAAASAPETHLDYTVLRNGDPVGHHQVDVIREDGGETVSIQTNIVVKVAFVPVYRFEHQGREVWHDGRLVTLRSTTNDDGDKHTLDVRAEGDHVDVTGDGVRTQAASGIVPASLWNAALVHQSVLLNTLTGKQMTVQVADLGEDTVRVHGGPARAHHYKVTGELERELWYDTAGTLVQVQFKAKDDSQIRYVLG